MSQDQASPPNRILNLREVQRLTSLSRATTFRGIASGSHPAPIKLTPGGRRVGFRESDVRAWLADPLGWPAQLGSPLPDSEPVRYENNVS